MKDILNITLLEGLQNELKGNGIAETLYQLVESKVLFKSKREENFALLTSRDSVSLNLQNEPKKEDQQLIDFLDMRLCHLAICNIKKYPGNLNSQKLYGLSLSSQIQEKDDFRNSTPLSSVFIGSNGVGKTSYYTALEYSGMRKSNSASNRGYSRKIGEPANAKDELQKDQSEFILHLRKNYKEASIQLFTKSGLIFLEGNDIYKYANQPIVTEAFYCSDYDVRRLEEKEDYTRFILKQLGLNYYYHCLQDLYYTGIRVKNEDQTMDNDIDDKTTNESVAISQSLLGVVLGDFKFDLDSFDDNIIKLSEDFYTASEPDSLVDLIREMTVLLRHEIGLFPKNNWFFNSVRQKYVDILKILGTLRQKSKRKDFYEFEDEKSALKEFLDFRRSIKVEIVGAIADLKTMTTEEKNEYIDQKLKSYINKRDKSIKPFFKSKNSFTFQNNVERERFWTDYNQLIRFLERRFQAIVESWFPIIQNNVETILEEYFEIDNDKFQINKDFNTFNVNLTAYDKIIDSKQSYPTVHKFIEFKVFVMSSGGDLKSKARLSMPPRAYLNTFKFKLFCVALKLALCCVVKKIYSYNFPFIIDDVFDSSDFDSRIKLKDFIYSMMECHKKILTEERFDLQLIFFTQDDLIGNQVYKGIIANDSGHGAKLSRIFDYHECDETDVSICFDNRLYSYSSTEDVIHQCV